jgi:hypothetical protein
MKRVTMLVAALVVAAGSAGAADAARFGGVIVAKDAKRKAVVVVSRGSVRTVRTPTKFRHLRVGQRVAANARKLSDGTYVAATIRGQGRVSRVRFRGVVVRQDRRAGRLILSAGKSVFAARMTGLSPSSAAPDNGLAPGDKVAVDGDVGKGSLEADEVDEVGHADLLELEGIFLHTTSGGFAIAVVHRGLVSISVPDGAIVPPFKAGDQVSVLVRVEANGSFTFRKGRSDLRDHGKHKDEAKFEAQGVLVGKSPLSVSVRGEKGTLTCAIPAGLDLAFFRIGEQAKLLCVSRDGDLVMVKLRTENGYVSGDGSGELAQHGVLTAKSATSIAVRREDTTLATCSLARAVDLSYFRVGEKVKLRCRLEADRWVFASLHGESASIDEDGRVELYAHGTLTAKTETSLTVTTSDGQTLTCAFAAGLDLSKFPLGTQVKLHCHKLGGDFRLAYMKSETAVVEVKN